MPRKKKRKSKPKPRRPKLAPWVVEASNAAISKNCKRKFSGYIPAFILSFLGVFHRTYGVFPTVQQIQQVFAYSQPNKPRAQIRRLEDEGYVQLDESRCFVVAILKAPYIVPRPDFAKEKLNGYYRRFGVPSESEESDDSPV